MPQLSPRDLMHAALDITGAAEAIPLRHFHSDLAVEDKPDESPVTIADRETEKRIREEIAARFPGHGIFGEEFGKRESDSEFTWIIDPIDGTRSFICGLPLFGMLLGVMQGDEAVAVFARLAEVDPDDFQYDLVRGWQALDRGDLGLAEHWLESAAGKTGTLKHLAYLKLGELHEKRRDFAAALAAYERALPMARARPAAGAHVEYLEAALRRLSLRRR